MSAAKIWPIFRKWVLIPAIAIMILSFLFSIISVIADNSNSSLLRYVGGIAVVLITVFVYLIIKVAGVTMTIPTIPWKTVGKVAGLVGAVIATIMIIWLVIKNWPTMTVGSSVILSPAAFVTVLIGLTAFSAFFWAISKPKIAKGLGAAIILVIATWIIIVIWVPASRPGSGALTAETITSNTPAPVERREIKISSDWSEWQIAPPRSDFDVNADVETEWELASGRRFVIGPNKPHIKPVLENFLDCKWRFRATSPGNVYLEFKPL